MGELLDITPHRIRQLENAGFFQKVERNLFNSCEVFQGYIKFLRDEGRRSNRSASASKLNDAKTQLVAVQVEERSKELINAARAEAVSAADEIIGEFKANLMAVPARVTLDVALRRKIEDEFERIFEEAAKTSRRVAAGEVEGSDTSEAGEEAGN